jgi:uncharacterized membrane-anchored protein YitT (DUF2179 family)
MPVMFTDFLQLHDTLLSAVFGGLLNSAAIGLCLFAGATTGGTDFIAIFFAEKYGKDTWNYIFVGNFVILLAAAALFKIDKALYSIIFQFTTTTALKTFYRGYQQVTLLIITDKSEEVYRVIRDKTHHDATSFTGIGKFKNTERVLLYSVVSASESERLIQALNKTDPTAFINVLKTEQIVGRFYKPPKD